MSVVECVKEITNNCGENINEQSSYSGVFTVAPSSGITQPRQSANIKVTFTPK